MNVHEWIADPRVLRIGLSLIHFLWQGLAVMAVLALLLRLMKRWGAGLRYAGAYLALLIMSALPIATYAWLQEPEALPAASAEALALPGEPATPPTPAAVAPSPARIARERIIHPEQFAWERMADRLEVGLYQAAPWVCGLWLLGVGCFSIPLLAGILQVSGLKRRRVRPADPQLHKIFRHLAHRMGVARAVALLKSELVEVPTTFGWLRPVVLLPAEALAGLVPKQIEALLAHELAHLRRHDYLANWLQTVIQTLLFYHPAVWWVSRRIRQERELCCDELAVAVCGDPLLYAHALTAMEALRPTRPAAVLSVRGGRLLDRVRRVLEPTHTPRYGAFSGAAGLVSLMVSAGLVLTVSAPLAAAQEARVLAFPADYSMGQLSIRDAGGKFTATGEGEGWRTFTEAQGEIEVPEGVEVMLRLTPGDNVDLAPLAQLAPDDLQRLDASSCNLGDDDLRHLAGLTDLKALSLNKNKQITVEGWKQLKGLTSLVWLGLEQTGFSDTDTHQLARLTQLQFLDVYESFFDDDDAAGLEGLASLRWLGLEATRITGAALPHLYNLSALEGLTLQKTAIDDASLAYLTGLPRLKLLVLEATPVSDAGAPYLATLPSLEMLSLNATQVTDQCLQALAQCPRLRTVDLANTAVTQAALDRFKTTLAVGADDAAGAVPAQSSSNPDAPKVGIILSHFTATGPHAAVDRYAYSKQANTGIAFLDEANFDLYAVVEPGTRNEGELPAILESTGLSGKVVDGTDVAALRQLDVLVAAWYLDVRDEMLAALTSAIEQGTGFVVLGPFGFMVPGQEDPRVQRLIGLQDPVLNWGNTGKCRVIAAHPILEGLKLGDAFVPDMVNGYVSAGDIQHGTALLGPPEEETGIPKNLNPMYVTTLGKGRIVHCQWIRFVFNESALGKYDLYIRSVNWAANRPATAQW